MNKELMDALRSIPPELLLEAYNDSSRGTLRQLGKVGEDLAKTLRLVLLPFQCTAFIQDRVEHAFKKAVEDVPEERRITPPESLILEVAEKLKYHPSDSIISNLYVNLITSATDADKVNKAHPAFIHVISQISPDEALFLREMSRNRVSAYCRRVADWGVVDSSERDEYFKEASFEIFGVESQLLELMLKPEVFYFPQNFYMYVEHLRALELIEYVGNDIKIPDEWRSRKNSSHDFWFINLSKFGQMFFECCKQGLSKQYL